MDQVTQAVGTILKARLIEILGGKDALVDKLIKVALEEKQSPQYGSKTIMEAELGRVIRKRAVEILDDWITSKEEQIRDLVRAGLEAKQEEVIGGLVGKIVSETIRIEIKVGERF